MENGKPYPRRPRGISSKINVIRYANDFIITASSKELPEKVVKPTVINFLKERRLSLSKVNFKIYSVLELNIVV